MKTVLIKYKALWLWTANVITITFGLLCSMWWPRVPITRIGFLAIFLLPWIDIVLIGILFKNTPFRQAGLVAIVMASLSTIQITLGYLYCDPGGLAGMIMFTLLGTIAPMTLFAIIFCIMGFVQKYRQ